MQVERPEPRITVSYRVKSETKKQIEDLAKAYDISPGIALESAMRDVWQREKASGKLKGIGK